MSGHATFLSGYRLMWILVMFDLPTDTKPQRKAAGDFRNFLLDEGFERSQFSIYARFINGKEAFERASAGSNAPSLLKAMYKSCP